MNIDQSWYQKPKGIKETESAGGIVVRILDDQFLVVLIREPEHDGYSLPKGHIEPNETPEQAAIREIEEETGLHQIKLISKLGILERLQFDKTEWKKTHYFLFLTNQETGTPTDQVHAQTLVEWFLLDKLPQMSWPEQKKLIEDNKESIYKLVYGK